jgi:hypothetical protein
MSSSDPGRKTITATQWCCLRDAVSGNVIAAAQGARDVWAETSDGAILHSARIVHALCGAGLLRRTSDDRYVATERSADALARGVARNRLQPLGSCKRPPAQTGDGPAGPANSGRARGDV